MNPAGEIGGALRTRQDIGTAALRLATGLAARALALTPLAVTQFHLDLALARLLRRHPEIVRRLSSTEERRALVVPSDLPVAFLVRCVPGRLFMTVVRKTGSPGAGAPAADAPAADATISGPIAAILDMATGEDDGDALFFSRIVKVEGDTEVAVALRNAIDSAAIDLLTDFLPAPLLKAPFVSSGVEALRRFAAGFTPDRARRAPLQEPSW